LTFENPNIIITEFDDQQIELKVDGGGYGKRKDKIVIKD
jgi:hypothetical protein